MLYYVEQLDLHKSWADCTTVATILSSYVGVSCKNGSEDKVPFDWHSSDEHSLSSEKLCIFLSLNILCFNIVISMVLILSFLDLLFEYFWIVCKKRKWSFCDPSGW
jgi:hypothetical protein